jgi:hypothetical protein
MRVICEFVINAVREIYTRTTHSSHGIHVSLSPAGTNVYLCLSVCGSCVRLIREEQFEETTSIKQCARQTSTQERARAHTNEQEREACESHKQQ